MSKKRLTIQLDERAEGQVRAAAERAGVPMATWIAHQARQAAIADALAAWQPDELSDAEDAEWAAFVDQEATEHLAAGHTWQ